MHNTQSIYVSDDDEFDDHDSAAEEDLLGKDHDDDSPPLDSSPTPRRSSGNSPPTSTAEFPPHSSTLSTYAAMCVVCNEAPVYRNGLDIRNTCGKTCASKLQALSGLPSLDQPRTSGPPNRGLTPPRNIFGDGNWVPSSWSPSAIISSVPPQHEILRSSSRPSEPTQAYRDAANTHSHSRFNQIRMCDVCHIRPRCQRGGRTYPTCGLSCAARLHAPGSVEMCDYCKKRPKVVINRKTYPQCGKTCRDKAKLAEAAANAAACTSCILCWKSSTLEKSDFCSLACQSLADARAPFLIEIPRGHVSFKRVAECFISEWQTSNMHCPAIKKVYMIVMKPSFVTSFNAYRTRTSSQNGKLQKKRTLNRRWLVTSRECGFGDPGDLEPCSSNKCLLCCIVRSSFNRLEFPSGIITSGLNRAVERYRSGKKSSSKIAALAHVVMGRQAEMTPRELQDGGPIPPQNTDSVRVVGVRKDGSRVDLGDNIVYDGDAIKLLYLISYE